MSEETKGGLQLATASNEATALATAAAAELLQWADLTSHAIEVLPLETTTDEEKAAKLAGELRAVKRRADDQRKKLIAPFRKAIAEVDAIFKRGAAQIEALEGKLRGRLVEASASRRRREAEAAEAARKAAVEAERALERAALASTPEDAEDATRDAREALDSVAASLTATKADAGPKGVHVRTDWSWEVEDLEKIPRAFLMVDPDRLRAFVRARADGEAPSPLPGIRWVKTERAVIR